MKRRRYRSSNTVTLSDGTVVRVRRSGNAREIDRADIDALEVFAKALKDGRLDKHNGGGAS